MKDNNNPITEQPKAQSKTFGENFNEKLSENAFCVTRGANQWWNECDEDRRRLWNDETRESTLACCFCPCFLLFSTLTEIGCLPVTCFVSAIQALCDTKKQNQDKTPTLV